MTTATSSRLHPSQFPIALAALSQSPLRLKRFTEALELLNAAVDAGAIANQIFIEVKSRFRTALGASWETHASGLVYGGSGPLLDLHYSIQTDALHLLASTRRKIVASKLEGQAIDAMLAVVGEFDPLAQAMEKIKDKVTKRQVKSEAEREAETRFVATPATPAATRKMYDVLIDITARNHDSMVTAIRADHMERVRQFITAAAAQQRKLYARPEYRSAVIVALKDKRTGREPDELRDDWESEILALAQRDANHLREAFICKLLRKLAPIVEAKGGLLRAYEIADSVRMSRLSGTLAVEFEDGSSFLADNNIVYSYSTLGNLFTRFPLTFHRVVMADGSAMKSPSEERMHTVFAQATAPAAMLEGAELEENEPDAPRG